jgi:hypothetical protein
MGSAVSAGGSSTNIREYNTAEKTKEIIATFGFVKCYIRNNKIGLWVGKGWHTGIYVNVESTNPGGDVMGTDQKYELTILKMLDQHGGYVIKSATKIWIPFSSSGYRSSTFDHSLESSPCSRWSIDFEKDGIKLSLGPGCMMRSSGWNGNDYSDPKEQCCGDQNGHLYVVKEGMFWTRGDSQKEEAALFSLELVIVLYCMYISNDVLL